MSAFLSALLAALPALFQEVPELVAALEKVIADFKNPPAPGTSLAAQVTADTQSEFDSLGTLPKK